ncbi:MAG: hypothetical protein J2P36_17470, partial [Ktedonobacteraceae bacterium]|nr:hypothetical protein [Ktedonobacteraceae bacterium]
MMLKRKGFDAVQRAFTYAWMDRDVMPDEMMEEKYAVFVQRWGGLDVGAFQRALQEGQGGDRLWAIFALGYLD